MVINAGDAAFGECTFTDNSATNGGAIAVLGGSADISTSTFEGNTASGDGGVDLRGSRCVQPARVHQSQLIEPTHDL